MLDTETLGLDSTWMGDRLGTPDAAVKGLGFRCWVEASEQGQIMALTGGCREQLSILGCASNSSGHKNHFTS